MAAKTQKSKVVPVGRRVVIIADAPETVTPGGIVLPDRAQEKMPCRGTVYAVSSDCDFPFAPNDKVVFNAYAVTKIEHGDQEFLVVDEKEVLVILS